MKNLFLLTLLSIISQLVHGQEIATKVSTSVTLQFQRTTEKRWKLGECWGGNTETDPAQYFNLTSESTANSGSSSLGAHGYTGAGVNWNSEFVNRTFVINFQLKPAGARRDEHDGSCTHDIDIKNVTASSSHLSSALKFKIPEGVWAVRLEAENNQLINLNKATLTSNNELIFTEKKVDTSGVISFEVVSTQKYDWTGQHLLFATTPGSDLIISVDWIANSGQLSLNSKIKVTLIGQDACENVAEILSNRNASDLDKYLRSIGDDLTLADSMGCFLNDKRANELMNGLTPGQLARLVQSVKSVARNKELLLKADQRYSLLMAEMMSYKLAYLAISDMKSYCGETKVEKLLGTEKSLTMTGFMANNYWLTRFKKRMDATNYKKFAVLAKEVETISKTYATYFDLRNDKKVAIKVSEVIDKVLTIRSQGQMYFASMQFPFKSGLWILEQIKLKQLGTQFADGMREDLFKLDSLSDEMYKLIDNLRVSISRGEMSAISTHAIIKKVEEIEAGQKLVIAKSIELQNWFDQSALPIDSENNFTSSINTLQLILRATELDNYSYKNQLKHIFQTYPVEKVLKGGTTCSE